MLFLFHAVMIIVISMIIMVAFPVVFIMVMMPSVLLFNVSR